MLLSRRLERAKNNDFLASGMLSCAAANQDHSGSMKQRKHTKGENAQRNPDKDILSGLERGLEPCGESRCFIVIA